jgi:hypothetical protein
MPCVLIWLIILLYFINLTMTYKKDLDNCTGNSSKNGFFFDINKI